MRLWSLHPKYLDAKGLTALWREALLAQAVLRGRTRGYRNHPQLKRFRDSGKSLPAINTYLWHVREEALRRGYAFDRTKVRQPAAVTIKVNRGQVAFEVGHLLAKLQVRDRARWRDLKGTDKWEVHPMMRVREGGVEEWERG
ncbi:MAG TPA: pyrimidine dimer DNA glycosylase/endonuclease V [Phycisphaerae bacterium]|jgi:hypothetical protein